MGVVLWFCACAVGSDVSLCSHLRVGVVSCLLVLVTLFLRPLFGLLVGRVPVVSFSIVEGCSHVSALFCLCLSLVFFLPCCLRGIIPKFVFLLSTYVLLSSCVVVSTLHSIICQNLIPRALIQLFVVIGLFRVTVLVVPDRSAAAFFPCVAAVLYHRYEVIECWSCVAVLTCCLAADAVGIVCVAEYQGGCPWPAVLGFEYGGGVHGPGVVYAP